MKQKRPMYKRKLFVALGIVLGLIIIILIAFKVSPWPGALVVRVVFNQGGGKTLAAMEATLPDYPVKVLHDEAYRSGDKTARLDVYIPESAQPDQLLPVVVWTHGGAWLSGDKKDSAPYFSRMADAGFVVVAPNYSLAPNEAYPHALHQLNDVHAYVIDNAARFNADPNKIVLAGDSAGAQLSSQLAALITSPAYATEVGIEPALAPAQLRAVLLYCGIYKMEGLAHPDPTLPKIVGWGDDVSIWAYTGSRHAPNELIREISPYYHVTDAFPATFISGGNGDPLTDAQSKPLADKLSSLGVDVTRLFYPADHAPSLPHEYQFTFNDDGEKAFKQTTQFLRTHTKEQ